MALTPSGARVRSLVSARESKRGELTGSVLTYNTLKPGSRLFQRMAWPRRIKHCSAGGRYGHMPHSLPLPVRAWACARQGSEPHDQCFQHRSPPQRTAQRATCATAQASEHAPGCAPARGWRSSASSAQPPRPQSPSCRRRTSWSTCGTAGSVGAGAVPSVKSRGCRSGLTPPT